MSITIGIVLLFVIWMFIIRGLVKSPSDKELWGKELEDE